MSLMCFKTIGHNDSKVYQIMADAQFHVEMFCVFCVLQIVRVGWRDVTQTLHTVQMSCSGHNSRDSCKQGQLWLLSILITSSGDCEFAELGVTPLLVVVSLLYWET